MAPLVASGIFAGAAGFGHDTRVGMAMQVILRYQVLAGRAT